MPLHGGGGGGRRRVRCLVVHTAHGGAAEDIDNVQKSAKIWGNVRRFSTKLSQQNFDFLPPERAEKDSV